MRTSGHPTPTARDRQQEWRRFAALAVLVGCWLLASVSSAWALLPPPTDLATGTANAELQRTYELYRFRPTNTELIERIAQLLETAGQLDDALTWYTEAHRLAPTADRSRRIAERAGWAGKPTTALAHTRHLLATDPNNIELQLKVAELAEWAGNATEAAQIFERVGRRRNDPELLRKAADRYLWSQQPRKAMPLLRQLLVRAPRDVELLDKAAEVAEWIEDLPGAIALLQRAEAVKPQRARRRKIADRLAWSGQLAQARDLFGRLCREAPRDTALRLAYADTLAAAGEASAAMRIYEVLPVARLSAAQRLTRAQWFLERGDASRALADARTVRDRSLTAAATGVIAAAAFTLGQWDEADRAYRQRLLAIEQEMTAGARAARKTPTAKPAVAAAIDGQTRLAEVRAIHERLLAIARQRHDRTGEVRALTALARLDPDAVTWPLQLAERAHQGGNERAAQLWLRQAQRCTPTDETVTRQIGESLLRSGERRQAFTVLAPLIERFHDDDGLRATVLALARENRDWKMVAALTWAEFRRDPSREQALALIDASVQVDQFEKAAEVAWDQVRRDPFDTALEASAAALLARVSPVHAGAFAAERPERIDTFYRRQIASLSAHLATVPGDRAARLQRAQIELWRQRPAAALPDQMAVLSASPTDAPLLRQTAETAEWAGLASTALRLRTTLRTVAPDDASTTLRLAQELGWRGRWRAAQPLYAEVWRNPALPRATTVLSAEPVAVQSGRRRLARTMHRTLADRIAALTPAQRDEWQRQRRELTRDLGPIAVATIDNRRDTEQIDHTRTRVFARGLVRDGRWADAELIDHRYVQRKYDHRSFAGRSLSLQFHRVPHAEQASVWRWQAVAGTGGETMQGFLPAFTHTWRRHDRETRLHLFIDPVFDTPEAVRQTLTKRGFDLTWKRMVQPRLGLTLDGAAGQWSDGNPWRHLSMTWERNWGRPARRWLRYTTTYDDSDGRGGNVYYSPRGLHTHQIALVGTDQWQRLEVNWELFAGRELPTATSGRADFRGGTLTVAGPLGRQLEWRLTGSALDSTISHFGDGGRYGQWQLGGAVEWRGW